MGHDPEFEMFTIFTMVLVFVLAFVGIGLMLAVMLSSIGLEWLGLPIGIAVGLYADYKMYFVYRG